tara:strand:- start:7508 stop:8038 length:531 start_codon:yes stop_codon:yes gene_type:complete
MNKLEMCIKCDAGLPVYHSETNSFGCGSCDNSAPNSYGGGIIEASRAWNDCNTPTRTMADVMAENESLRADILKTVIESGEVLKHHTSMVAHIERLHYSLCEMTNAVTPSEGDVTDLEILARAKEAIIATPAQSLSVIEAGAIRKAAHALCQALTGKKLVSHTNLVKYAEHLEQMK